MPTTKADISRWFDDGVGLKRTHMIVVVDTYDYADYPVYASSDADALMQYHAHNGKNMQCVMEVYDLRLPKQAQLDEYRAFHLPSSVGS